tara:strand:- start:755 stop:1030 length:276 start_codon:yes stop_codon:yes gene_type:complete
MAVISSGVNPKQDCNKNLKNRRKALIELERIRTLEKSLICFSDLLLEKYNIIYRCENSSESDGDNVKAINVNINEIKELIRDYAKTKPIGF